MTLHNSKQNELEEELLEIVRVVDREYRLDIVRLSMSEVNDLIAHLKEANKLSKRIEKLETKNDKQEKV